MLYKDLILALPFMTDSVRSVRLNPAVYMYMYENWHTFGNLSWPSPDCIYISFWAIYQSKSKISITKHLLTIFERSIIVLVISMPEKIHTNSHLTVIRQSSDSHKPVIKQSSLIRQSTSSQMAVERQSSGNQQAVKRQSKGIHQAVIRQSSGSHQ